MKDENSKLEEKKLNAWVTEHQRDFLKSKADIEGVSISALVRQAVELLENVESLNTNIDKICEIIDTQIDRSFKKNLDRLIALVVKGVIASESANHNSAEIVAKLNNVDISEVKDTAYHYAINYIKKKVNNL